MYYMNMKLPLITITSNKRINVWDDHIDVKSALGSWNQSNVGNTDEKITKDLVCSDLFMMGIFFMMVYGREIVFFHIAV